MNTYETIELPQISFDQLINHSDRPLGLGFVRVFEEITDKAHNDQHIDKKFEQVVWQERERLARELHDTIVPEIYSIGLFVEALQLALEAGKEDAVARGLEELRTTARESLAGLRLILLGLRPTVLDEIGLVDALQTWLRTVESRFGLHIELRVAGDRSLSGDVEEALYRIVQEALNNVQKHAEAKQVIVDLQLTSTTTSLTVKDDGKGFDLEAASITGGLGLQNIRQRAKDIHASFAIETAPGNGTCLSVIVPN